jgi:hypothetical protein
MLTRSPPNRTLVSLFLFCLGLQLGTPVAWGQQAPTAVEPLPAPANALFNPLPTAAAKPPETVVAPQDLTALHAECGWPAGTIAKQMDKDATLVPYGKGAIFVPAMAPGLDEPPVTVWRGQDKVADAVSGARIVLIPGLYYVQLGSGSTEQRFGRQVEVKEMQTTVIPVSWAGLTVHVVDAQLNSLRNAYEVIRMRDREYLGIGFGADEQAGEPVNSWVLEPGLYKLVRIGGTYHDRTDFSTVRLVRGQHTQYLLVQDPVTGQFQGAGEARQEELFHPGSSLRPSLILGGDVTLNSRRSVASYPNGSGYTLQGFIDTKASGLILDSPFLARLQISEGQTKLPDFPWQKTHDFAQIDLLYVYNYRPWAGPYIRAQGVTNLFSTFTYFETPQSLSITDQQSSTVTLQENLRSVKLTPPLGTLAFSEGAGLNWRLFKAIFGEMTLRTGLGLRQVINHNVLQPEPNTTSQFLRLKSGRLFGFETSVIAIGRLTRFLVVNAVVQSLIPFNTQEKVDLQINATAALKLTQYAAINYVLTFHQGPFVGKTNIEQDVLLRFSLELL